MRSAIVPLFTVVVIGVVIGLFLQSFGSDKVTRSGGIPAANANIEPAYLPFTEAGDAKMTALAEQLAAEIEARKALQATVDTLAAQLAQLTRERPILESAIGSAQSGGANPASANAIGFSSSAGGTWFNEQALIDVGMDATEARRIKTVYEEQALERLYLQDQAAREGWNGAKRREAFQALASRQQALKTELGDAAYDAYLYASRQPNRVQVQGVLAGSAAANAGIQDGDYILSYNDQRVYNGQELRKATSQGATDEVIVVTVERDDSQQQLYIPRGPLGIRMNSASVAP